MKGKTAGNIWEYTQIENLHRTNTLRKQQKQDSRSKLLRIKMIRYEASMKLIITHGVSIWFQAAIIKSAQKVIIRMGHHMNPLIRNSTNFDKYVKYRIKKPRLTQIQQENYAETYTNHPR